MDIKIPIANICLTHMMYPVGTSQSHDKTKAQAQSICVCVILDYYHYYVNCFEMSRKKKNSHKPLPKYFL